MVSCPGRARDFGEEDDRVGADGWSRAGSGRERERGLGRCWAAREVRENGPRLAAGLTGSAPLSFSFFFTDSFLFLITEINITFEIQFQIGSNQFHKFCKIKIISLNTLEPFP